MGPSALVPGDSGPNSAAPCLPKTPAAPNARIKGSRDDIDRTLFKLRYQCDRQHPALIAAFRTEPNALSIKYSRTDHIRNVVTEYTQHYAERDGAYVKMGKEVPTDNIFKVQDARSGRVICGLCEPRNKVLGVYVYDETDDTAVVDAFEMPMERLHNTPLLKQQRFYPPYAVRKNGRVYVVYLAEPVVDEDEATKWLTAHNAGTLEKQLHLGEQSDTLIRPQAFLLDVEDRRIVPLGSLPTAVVQATVLNDSDLADTRSHLCRGDGCWSQSSAGDHTRSEDERHLECSPAPRADSAADGPESLETPAFFDIIVSHLHPRFAYMGITHHPMRALLHTLLRVELATGAVIGSVAILEDSFCLRDFLAVSSREGLTESRYSLLCIEYPDAGEHALTCVPQLLSFNVSVSEGAPSAPAVAGGDDATPDNRTCDTKDSSIGLEISRISLNTWQHVLTGKAHTDFFLPIDVKLTADLLDRSSNSGYLQAQHRGEEKLVYFRYSVAEPYRESVVWTYGEEIAFPSTNKLWLNKGGSSVLVKHNTLLSLTQADLKGSALADHLAPIYRLPSPDQPTSVSPRSAYEAFFLPDVSPAGSVIIYRRKGIAAGTVGAAMIFSHGGPNSMAYITRGNNAFFNFIFAATTVDMIVVPNYPGSTGYDEVYTRSLAGQCGEKEVLWCLQALQKALDHEFGVKPVNQRNYATLDNDNWPYANVPCIAYGGSHGGFITGHLVTRTANVFHCGIMLNPVTDASMHTTDIPDWASYQMAGTKFSINSLTPDESSIRTRQYLGSPIAHVKAISCPVLLLLGQKDRRVDWHQGRNFYLRVREIEKLGKSTRPASRCMVYKDSNHSLSEPSVVFHRDVETAKFINLALRSHA